VAGDPLRVLLAVRGRLVDEARAALAACLRAEADAEERIRLIDAAARRDRATSAEWQDAHRFVEMTAARREAVQVERHNAVLVLAGLVEESSDARDVVTAARTAAETVEQLIAERDAASRVESAKKEQHTLDDIARARFSRH
jgi:ABC-type transporter Mla subunit MlaD